MAGVALLKFTQDVVIGGNGQALIGDTAHAVVASNSSNTDVASWEYEMLYVPPGSAVPLSTQGPGLTSTFTFSPDVSGSYRVRLTTVDDDGAIDKDIRVFSVPFSSGLIAPPYQGDPLPLSLAVKPDELNFSGQSFGWAGGTGQKLLHEALSLFNQQIQKWTLFTPTLQTTGGDFVLGNGSVAGRWRRSGPDHVVDVVLKVGSTTVFGTGSMIIPLAASSPPTPDTGQCIVSGANTFIPGFIRLFSGEATSFPTFGQIVAGTVRALDNATIVLANGGVISTGDRVGFFYEVPVT